MRTISGTLVPNNYTLTTPFRMLISGSTGTGKKLKYNIYVYIDILGKTTFVQNLIQSNRVDRKWRNIYYIYPFELGEPPVDWDRKFTDINVHFLTELPTIKFFDSVEKHSLVVFDDLWSECSGDDAVIKCFKVRATN